MFIIICVLTACTEETKEYNYTGKSDNWKINYGKDEDFIMEYIGGSSEPEEISYLITQGSRKTDGRSPLHEGIVKIDRPFSEEDAGEIKVKINWNQKTETVHLSKH